MFPAHSEPIHRFALRTTPLTKLYGETVALWHVSIEAESGDLVALTGANGSGKSTLLRAVVGLTALTNGSVSWVGAASAGLPRLAYVGHRTHLYESLTPTEHVVLSARLARHDPSAALDHLGQLGLSGVAGRPCSALSAGTRRRVALARALATRPHVLAVDEPFAGVDAVAAELVAERLEASARAGCLVLVAGQGDGRLRRIATRVFELQDGHLVQPVLVSSRSTG